jgi:hypothetical protein
VGKVKDFQVEAIGKAVLEFGNLYPVHLNFLLLLVDQLCNNMVGDKEQLRDISSIGLKVPVFASTIVYLNKNLQHTGYRYRFRGKPFRQLETLTNQFVLLMILGKYRYGISIR